MLVRKSDIGGEIISILTRGMYLDPKDALREYVQNGVDASANNISIKIRQDIVVVQDNGIGMNKDTMRNAIRVGISEKNPNSNVGFMGIGIYSSFHLCDELHIFSKTRAEQPNHLYFNFRGMRERLAKQRELKFSSGISEDEIVALQDLLEQNIELTSLKNEDFPNTGTRVELRQVEPTFFKNLSKFSEVANYLEQVVALPFNPKFIYGNQIQNYIRQVCQDHKLSYSLVHLDLQVNDESSILYRPYLDEHFDPSALEPKFYTLKFDKEFYGIAWGCLNKSTNSIRNTNIRGFIIKKHGFTIGDRHTLSPYFGRQTFYNRYVGEVIVLHTKLLPNAARTDFEYSPLKTNFRDCLNSMASFYYHEANDYQETYKALEDLNEAISFLKERKAQYEFFIDNSDELLVTLWDTKKYVESLSRRKNEEYFRDENVEKAGIIINQLEEFSKLIRDEIDIRKRKRKKTKSRSESDIAADTEEIPEVSDSITKDEFENLLQVFDSLGLELSKEMNIFIKLIDEEYIRNFSSDSTDYNKRLSKLKTDFEELLEE